MKRERPLSRTQLIMLKLVRDGEPYNLRARGMSEYAGAETTKWSLIRRGLFTWHDDDLVITAAGRDALRKLDED